MFDGTLKKIKLQTLFKNPRKFFKNPHKFEENFCFKKPCLKFGIWSYDLRKILD